MVSASRLATVLPFRAISAPVAHPNAERLTGAFLCERGAYEKTTTSQLRTAGGGMVVCICPPYIQIKKEEEFSPMGVVRRVCVFLHVCCPRCPPCPPCPPRPPCPRCPCRPPRIIYGMADNRRTTDRGLCEFVVRPEKPDISRVCGLGGQGGQHGQQGGQNRVLVRPLSA